MAEKILIVGLGSIGRRYARLLRALGHTDLCALRSGRDGQPCDGVKDLYTWEEVKEAAPGVAFITNPTANHIDAALRCAELGMHLFIEKPLDRCLDRLDALRYLVKEKNLSVYVAYNLRFHPGVKDLRELISSEGFEMAQARCSSWLPDWRPGTDHLKSYSANAALGGGVVLDLSHDPDYCSYIFGGVEAVRGTAGNTGTVTVDAEDTADMALHLFNGGRVDVHLDFCTPKPTERRVKAVTRKGTHELDLVAGRLFSFSGGQTQERKYDVDRDYTYKAEIEYFFANLGGKMMNDLDEAGALLGKLLEFKLINGLK